MKFSEDLPELDPTDLAILDLLQRNCKQPLAAIGEKVGLSAPAVVERIHKLEEAGVITDYVALLDARLLGQDITAFIGVSTSHPRAIAAIERQIAAIEPVLECHHVTGVHTLLLKVKATNTAALERLIDRIRSIDDVTRTETMVVLSTHVERVRVPLGEPDTSDERPPRRAGGVRSKGVRVR
jgi:Lrp/AsnC family leucine-responsive transcriptional regulator